MKKIVVVILILALAPNVYATDYSKNHAFAHLETLTHTLLNSEFDELQSTSATKADKAGYTSTGTITSSAVAIDVTTGANEDYTISPNGTGNVELVTDELNFNDGAATISTTGNANLTFDVGTGSIDFNDETILNFTGGGGTGFNFVKNGTFESWSAGAAVAPNMWTLAGAGATIAREAATIKMGTYSCAVTRVGANTTLTQNIISVSTTYGPIAYWQSRQVTIGCWVYATVADRARLQIGDGVGSTNSTYHTGDSTWQYLTVTHTMDAASTALNIQCAVNDGNTTAYFDGAAMIEGSNLESFAQNPNDEQLMAIAYQSTAPANFIYSNLRMECGTINATQDGGAACPAQVVTFGTAFTTVLVSVGTVLANGDGAYNVGIQSQSTTGIVVEWRDVREIVGGITLPVNWIAIGVD